MDNSLYIFLDIDGVLVKESLSDEEIEVEAIDLEAETDLLKFDSDCLTEFESVLRKHSHYQIVISSSWREVFSFNSIKRLFSKDIAARVIGMTSSLENSPLKYLRYHEVLDYLRRNHSEAGPWVAIDDTAEHFPPVAPVIVTDPYLGFDERAANQLDTFLRSGKL